MDIGIALATSTESWKWIKKAEELGFTHAWLYDTQLLNPDVFICLTQAALNTSHIRLGTGVLVPSNRIEPVTANAFATLNKIAPGRIDFGVGSGFTARRTMGLDAIPLVRMESYIVRIQALLRGEMIEWEFEGKKRKIRFLNPELNLINLEDEVKLHVSALGPRTRKLAAKLGAGWLNFSGLLRTGMADLEDMQIAWRTAGQEAAPYCTLFTMGRVLDEGEAIDSVQALNEAGPLMSVFFHNLVETTTPGQMRGRLPSPLYDALEQYREMYLAYEPEDARYLTNHRGHLMFQRPEELALMTPQVIDLLNNFIAPPAQLVNRFRQLRDAGYSQITVQLVEHHESAIERWSQVLTQL